MIDYQLPKLYLKLFEWFCRTELFEELQGDLEEAFEENIKLYGARKARNIYRLEVLKMIRPSVVGFGQFYSKFNHLIMFKNYFKTSMRSMMRSPLSSFINVFGLSVAIGICLIVYAFIDQDISVDQFHKNKHEVHVVTAFSNEDGELLQYGQTPLPLAQMLEKDFPQIDQVCRIEDLGIVLKYGDKVFHERVRMVDPTFLEMFTFPMQWGDTRSLKDPNSIILSDEMSVKYFGDLNPVGKDLLMKFEDEYIKSFTISGVAAPFPKSHAIDFDFLVNFENIRQAETAYDPANWNRSINATLISIRNPSNIDVISDGMDAYKLLQNESNPNRPIESFALVSIANLHAASNDIINGISYGMRKEGWVILSIMAGFILLLACMNYINIGIVSAAKRLKEIGVRKVIGANRGLVIIQFLAENVLLTFFALLFGLFLAYSTFIPWFNGLFGRGLELVLMDIDLWIFLFGMLLLTGLASGIYPALYISKFQVVGIFRGSVRLGKKNPLTKIFLTFQLILAFIAISGGVWFTQNNAYQSTRSWGYEPSEALYVDVPDQSAFDQLYASMSQNPNVLSISGSSQHLGHGMPKVTLDLPDRKYEVGQFAVDAYYFETMGLDILEGRAFKPNLESDKRAIVVNEQFVHNLALQQPIGEIVKMDSSRFEIVGVVKDFHNWDFDTKIQPMIFKVAATKDFRYLSMKVRSGKQSDVYQGLREEWMGHFPNTPFQGGYQEGVFSGYFDYLDSSAEFMRALAIVAIILASLGLYGLITLNVSGRVREFSIRKVLGASVQSVATMITKQYVLLFVLSMLIGAPAGYFLIETLFDTVFAYHMPMNYSGLIISACFLVSVLLSTIFTQVRKISRSNPVDGLKVE
ncbi:MAG: FtsX-like permease family protein [Reichenbachiella sp.]|uniref:ABC transporter permease n=1 Tax=Reichenbachiella sp. TaxID=2184521 RepID=UPI002965DA12|nr:ABC transporter permease [Reichenbachiella sp.]MDW3210678.1 FtsX-like permease family protein [Reichenbachiella sp.]